MCDNIEILLAYILLFILGINNSANDIGLAYGCKFSYKRLVLLFSFFVILGTFFAYKVGKTVNSISTYPFLSLTITTLILVVSNYLRVPISIHTLIISSLAGLGFEKVNYSIIFNIILSWILSPLLALIMAYILYIIYENLSLPLLKKINFIKIMLLLSSGLIAFNLGSNDLPTILGLYTTSLTLYLIGGLCISLGALFGKNISETLTKITNLSTSTAFIAQFSGGVSVLLFTYLGLPVSTTYAIVGGIVGVGLTKGIKTIKFKILKKVILWWIFAPIFAFLLGVIFSLIIKNY